MDEIENILLREEHVVAVHYDAENEIPDIDLSLWSSRRAEYQKRRLSYLEEYLNLPYFIEDDFEDNHPVRRVWREKLESKYNWFSILYEKNALRYNHLVLVAAAINSLDKEYMGSGMEEFSNLKGKLMSIIPKYANEYDKMSTRQKIEHIKKIKNEVYSILRFLSEQKPSI